MSWFKVDDGWADHPKVRRAEKDGRALWSIAGAKCAQNGTDGLVDPRMLRESYAPLAGVQWRKAAQLLVSSGLWHDALTVTDCSRCVERLGQLGERDGIDGGELAVGWFVFHDWAEYQPGAKVKGDPIAEMALKRGRDLRRTPWGKQITAKVRQRDRDQCRYCGVSCLFGTQDRRSPRVGTIDHVNPFDFETGVGGNSEKNCVVACNLCNGRKGQRTPEQWLADEPDDARPLLKPGGRPTSDEPETDRVPVVNQTSDGPVRPSRGARPVAGPGSDRVVSVVGGGSGSGRVALGLVPGGGS